MVQRTDREGSHLMKKRALVIGSNGQLGSDLSKNCPLDFEIINHTRDQCDITDQEKTYAYLDNMMPQIIVNTAAFHNTDKCEENPDLSFSVNGLPTSSTPKSLLTFTTSATQYSSFPPHYYLRISPYLAAGCRRPGGCRGGGTNNATVGIAL